VVPIPTYHSPTAESAARTPAIKAPHTTHPHMATVRPLLAEVEQRLDALCAEVEKVVPSADTPVIVPPPATTLPERMRVVAMLERELAW
jgi:hypothetical protein